MTSMVKNANDLLGGYKGGNGLFHNPDTKIKYTEVVRELALKLDCYWFIDLIASYQEKLKDQKNQVWKLEREYSYTDAKYGKVVQERKNCFNVVCEDGNDVILIKEHIPFSDFSYDEYTVWCINGVIRLSV